MTNWAQILRQIAPGANMSLVSKIAPHLDGAMEKYGITTYRRRCHFLAHMAHETGGFRSLEESLTYTTPERIRKVWPTRFKSVAAARKYVRNPKALAIFVYGGRLGNRPAPSTDGWDYRGGGAYQLTGRENYRNFGRAAGVDLESNPEQARDPKTSVYVAAAYFKARMSGAADADDITGSTKALNGGTIGLADRILCLQRARACVPRDAKLGIMAGADEEDAELPIPVPKFTPSEDDIEDVQERLRELGYYEVGKVDGKIGPSTRAGVRIFREVEGLPPGETIDLDVIRALNHAKERPIAAERALATTEEVAAVVPEVKASIGARFWAGLQAIGAFFAALYAGIRDYFDDAMGYLSPLQSFLGSVPGWVWLAGAATLAGFIWWRTNRVTQKATEAYQVGARR